MAVLFVLSGVITYALVNNALFQPIDDVLTLRSTTDLTIFQRQRTDLSQIANSDPLSNVFYTVYDISGTVRYEQEPVPTDKDLVSQALGNQTVKATIPIGDGQRMRVLITPIYGYGPYNGQVIGALQVATPLDITDERLTQLTQLLAGTSGVLLIIAALASYFITGRALLAVERVTRKVQQIEQSQDLTQRLPNPGTDDELGHLVGTFNSLIQKLQASFETQRRFVADSSHELRTPITVIKSNMHLLRRATSPDERTELIATTEAEVSRLNQMVNDLLYMAQMQAGIDIKPILRPVELDSVLLEVFARARSIAALKSQKIVLAHEDIASTTGDRDQLQHLMLNLVDNAMKYTQEGGTIRLGLWKDGEWARIEVSDDGPGVPADELPHIFDRFYRTPEARVQERNGSGLGLAIVKSIAEAHGGRVEAFSETGEGSTFRVWLQGLGGALSIDSDADFEDPELPDPARSVPSIMQGR